VVSPRGLVEAYAIWYDDGETASVGYATANETYEFEVIGPTNTLVPITADFQLAVAVSPWPNVETQVPDGEYSAQFVASATISIDFYNGNLYQVVNGGGSGSSIQHEGTFVGNPTLSVMSDTIYDISLSATVINTDYGSVVATADPYIFIDPSFLALNPGYTIVFSPGISNSIADTIPEPSTWAMMLLGFAGLAFAGFRQRQKLSGAASV
jgi:hypothetical protein